MWSRTSGSRVAGPPAEIRALSGVEPLRCRGSLATTEIRPCVTGLGSVPWMLGRALPYHPASQCGAGLVSPAEKPGYGRSEDGGSVGERQQVRDSAWQDGRIGGRCDEGGDDAGGLRRYRGGPRERDGSPGMTAPHTRAMPVRRQGITLSGRIPDSIRGGRLDNLDARFGVEVVVGALVPAVRLDRQSSCEEDRKCDGERLAGSTVQHARRASSSVRVPPTRSPSTDCSPSRAEEHTGGR